MLVVFLWGLLVILKTIYDPDWFWIIFEVIWIYADGNLLKPLEGILLSVGNVLLTLVVVIGIIWI